MGESKLSFSLWGDCSKLSALRAAKGPLQMPDYQQIQRGKNLLAKPDPAAGGISLLGAEPNSVSRPAIKP